ncbi:MAG: GNAT family N-acetyltransferase [Gaiellaceae bacterium]
MLERRSAADEDEAFLQALLATTRPGLPGQLLDLQLRAQRREWEARFPGSVDEIVLLDGRPVGRLWVAWMHDACVLVDMALLPEHRRTGIGTEVVGEVLAEADRRGVPVRVTVERANEPSLAFCAKHGFIEVDADQVLVALERPVSPVRPPRASE